MHRIRLTLLVVLIIAANARISSADESRSARQTFVVRVPPKISFETAEVVPPPATDHASASNARSTSEKVETAFRLSGTGAAGITAYIEVQAAASVEAGLVPQFSLRIVGDEKNQWTMTNQPNTADHVLQASSSGTGAATLIISSGNALAETVIVTTIISKELPVPASPRRRIVEPRRKPLPPSSLSSVPKPDERKSYVIMPKPLDLYDR